ncbi:non-ribosomal peptide synthetase [Streptomyces tateyamensis]|uniref:Non-ribosomal peptide synthetase n=1 Tax=Streptomyces tateyamensis TaxID=565073 RepID=A0A2V4P267_9ACTN|nr:non-ribosomal peptide synthetase/MFS transporter [Streptomyces tateyamensis]PYC87631.1 non-ribosomal peptide synthetase [Streptomyces tateyamensis]
MTTTDQRLAERLARAKARKPAAAPVFPPRPAGPTPLSDIQRRLWFLHRWAPDSAAYTIPVAWRLRGRLDPGRLAEALSAVAARHEILRTRYLADGGEPTAVVDAPAPVPLPVREAPDGLDAALRRAVAEPFALDLQWPLRAELLRLAPEDHVLVVCLHHIAADGWSVGLLTADLAAAWHSGGPLSAAVGYADVVHARRERTHEAELAYWKQRLAGAPTVLELPADRPRQAVADDAGATLRLTLDEATTAALRRLATGTRCTGFMVLLAAFQALCARYAGVDDVLVGTPVAGRDEVPEVFGCFLDTIVLRSRFPEELTGRQLLSNVRESTLADIANSALPFDRVVGLGPRQVGHHPVYQVQLVATHVPRVPLRLAGLDVAWQEVEPETAKVDLSLAAEDLGGATVEITATYRTALFDRETVERFAGHYVRLLAALAADPDAVLDRLPILGPDEAPAAALPPQPVEGTVLDRFDRWVHSHPDRPAVQAPDGTLGYAELDRTARGLAERLRGAAVVAVQAAPGTGFLAAVLACWRAGAAYLPLDPALPAARQEALLASAGAALLVSGPAHDLTVRRIGADGTADPGLAYVMFTSGSTGPPKGVAVGHDNLAAYLAGVSPVLTGGQDEAQQYAVCSTLAADLGHTMLFGALWAGGTVRLLDPAVVADADALAEALAEHPVDLLKLVPSQLAALLTAERPADLLPRHCLVLGGEAVGWELVDRVAALRPGLRIVNHYGPTETTVGVLTHVLSEVPPARRPAAPPLGRPLPHVEARILDRHGEPVPLGVPGELWIGGPAVARGYLGDPDRTAERFTTDPATGTRRYRTGDRVRLRPDGTVEFLGRDDRQVKIRGYRVEPGEVEAALRAEPGITDAAVLAADGRLVAYLAATGPDALDGLADRLAARLPAHLVPAVLVPLDALPLTANGKVDRAALPAAAAPATAGRPPTTRWERAVAAVFGDLLGTPVTDVEADFFALGGHSLLATRAVSRLRRDLGVALPLPVLFAHPTVAGLARRLAVLRTDRDARPPLGPDTGALPPLRAGSPVTVSYAQQRLWFLDQVTPGNPAYNLPYALRLDGDLDPAALAGALTAVVARHDSLRTVFPAADGAPAPRVLAPSPVALPVADLRDAGAERIRAEVDAEFRHGFDLAAGPLLRARLLRVEDHAHLLLLTFHHIVFDGWSYALFADQVGAAYTGTLLPPPGVQYADHAAWQRGTDHAGGLAHWRELLRDAPPWLELPADRPRPAVPSHLGGAVPVAVPAEVSAPLLAVGRAEGATAFMTLFAAYQVLLARYAGTDDLVVGVPVAGRHHPDADELIGFFVNMLPLRGRPRPELTFREHLREVRGTCVAAFGHADVPFEWLVEQLAPVRDPGRTPLFSTMFALQNMPAPVWRLPGLTATPVDGPTGVAKFDLSLILVEQADGLTGALEYSADVLAPATAERLAGYFATLLRALAADPDTALADLPLADAVEHHRVLTEWNDTAAELPAATVPEQIAAQAVRTPHAVAVGDGTRTLDYAELDRRADRLARVLVSHGVGPQTVVGVAADRTARLPVALLAVLRAGGAYLPLDPDYPAERLAHMLGDSGAAALLTDDGAPLPGVPFDGPVLALDGEPARDPGDRTPLPAPDPDRTAYLLYTSGSTGRPKGVAVPHRALANLLGAVRSALGGFGPGDVLPAITTLSFDIAGLELWLPLVTGARVEIVDRTTVRDGAALARRIADSAATLLQATPATWGLLLDAGWTGNPALTALCGGEALPAGLAAALRPVVRSLWNLYGPTEATIWATARLIDDDCEITVGRPLANTTAYVLDDRLRPAPIGAVGQLHLGGAGLAHGYHRRPDLTAAAFVPNPFGPGRLYRTGDLARYRADGQLLLLGRADGQLKLRGHRIETGEIEAVLAEHPDIRRAAVVLRPDRAGEPQLVGFLVTARPVDPVEAVAWLRGRLPAHLVPARLAVIDELPLSPAGKVDRAALPALPAPAPQAPAGRPDTPTSPAEALVADVFRDVLERQVGLDEDFFAAGGDSMRAVRAVRRIDPELSVLDLFTHPTVRALAARLGGPGRTADLIHRMTGTTAEQAEVTVLAVPFGGAGAIVYRDLAERLPDSWALYAVQPPGRDLARPEEAAEPIAALARRCAERILAERPGPVVLYGHCVGAALATAVEAELRAAGHPVLGLVVGAAFPIAELPGPLGRLARLAPGRRQSDRALTDGLRVLGGLAEDLPEQERRLLAAAVRHDAVEAEHFYGAPAAAGPTPVLVVVGERDRVTEFHQERAHEWTAYGRAVDTAVVPGAGHFFQREPALAELLHERVERWRRGEGPVEPPEVPPPARLTAFLTVTLGQLVSLVGTGLSTFALGLWAYRTTGAVTAFAAIAAFALLPAILAAPVAGAVADRHDRRRVMIGCDLAGLGSSVAAAALLTAGSLRLWQLYAVVVVGAVAAAFRQPAYLAAVTQLTPKRYLGQANGVVGLGTATGTLFAQLLGGALAVAVGLATVVWLDVATFAVSLATLLVVRFPDLGFVRRNGPLLREITEGWRFLARRRGLIALAVFFAVANALGGVVTVLVTPLVLAFGSPATLGLVLAAQGAGLLAGSALMAVWGGTRRRAAGMIAFVGLFAVSAVLIGLRPTALFPTLGSFGIGVCAALINAHWLALVQLKVGLDLQGRVLATCLMLARLVMPVGYLVTGPLTDHVFEPLLRDPGTFLGSLIGTGHGRGMAAVIILTGLAALAWTAAGYGYRPLREADDSLPDSGPSADARPADPRDS